MCWPRQLSKRFGHCHCFSSKHYLAAVTAVFPHRIRLSLMAAEPEPAAESCSRNADFYEEMTHIQAVAAIAAYEEEEKKLKKELAAKQWQQKLVSGVHIELDPPDAPAASSAVKPRKRRRRKTPE